MVSIATRSRDDVLVPVPYLLQLEGEGAWVDALEAQGGRGEHEVAFVERLGALDGRAAHGRWGTGDFGNEPSEVGTADIVHVVAVRRLDVGEPQRGQRRGQRLHG
jgi:hypothetical protein